MSQRAPLVVIEQPMFLDGVMKNDGVLAETVAMMGLGVAAGSALLAGSPGVVVPGVAVPGVVSPALGAPGGDTVTAGPALVAAAVHAPRVSSTAPASTASTGGRDLTIGIPLLRRTCPGAAGLLHRMHPAQRRPGDHCLDRTVCTLSGWG